MPPTDEATFARSPLLPDASTTAQIRDLLRSNSERPDDLRSRTSALSDELARHDGEISRLRVQLEIVESDRAALQVHYDACHSFLAPIRRVPAEILTEIFAYCRHHFSTDESLDDEEAKSRLHHHGTRSLRSILWRHSWGRIQETMRVLRLVLERSGNSLLNVAVDHGRYRPSFHLLALHSQRWKTARISCPAFGLRDFAAAKGNLPFLESLELLCTSGDLDSALDIFQDAPKLINVTIGGTMLSTIPQLPLGQLRTLACMKLAASNVASAMGLVSRLSPSAKVRLQFDLSVYDDSVELNIPPTTCDIGTLSLETTDDFNEDECAQVFGSVYSSLTLPHLQRLEFDAEEYPNLRLPWIHSHFLALAARSSFQHHLRFLGLFKVVITVSELIETLSALPLLQALEISDQQNLGGVGIHHHLITDTLFRHLIGTANSSPPVPCLNSISCRILFQFDDSVYLTFLLSRLDGTTVFNAILEGLPNHHWVLDPNVTARLQELCEHKNLVFSSQKADE
ncbi:hypothetical protein B0H11DRAFT_2191369 [Mycena galericulata]|nr:hypothetical protein B0H11DRAFT_2191369 [Mycena galericulata]